MIISIYTDGACRGNQFDQNLGAWAYKIIYKDEHKELYTHYNYEALKNTTNNIMELTAIIKALECLTKRLTKQEKTTHLITIYSDSMYAIAGVNLWSKRWIARGWKNVKNSNLWKQLLELKQQFKNIQFQHVTGHNNNQNNEFVDQLCNKAMDKFSEQGE